jgi:hypothetical protein
VSSDGKLLGASLVLLAASAALLVAGLGQFRACGQALRLCEQLQATAATLQASVDRLSQASGAPLSAPAQGHGAAAGAKGGPGFDQPVPELPDGEALKAYQKALAKRNQEQHEQDAKRYGPELATLYREALDEEGSGSRESNRAFGLLVEKYPEAHATGMAIANRGLLAAMKQRTEDVQMFRNMLSRKPHFKRVVTDSHVDAYPSLCGYLANRCVMDGRAAEAEELLAELEKDFEQSYVAVGGFGSKPMLVPIDRFAERVRSEAKGPPKPPAPPSAGG